MNHLNKFVFTIYLIRYMGLKWLVGRVVYAVKIKSGWIRFLNPTCSWEDVHEEQIFHSSHKKAQSPSNQNLNTTRSRFFFKQSDFVNWKDELADWDHQSSVCSVVYEANRIIAGEICFFEKDWIKTGFPPQWMHHAYTGRDVIEQRHWSQINDFEFGDIKVFWEPSRFGFVFALVRAYARTEDTKYAEAFWCAVESWSSQNCPQRGLNWKCGQEASFRLMAWCFGYHAFLNCTASTPERVSMLHKMLFIHGIRIEANLGYAISQKNNHGISEAVGLWTLGLLFPEFRSSEKWLEMGRRWIVRQSIELIYEDGSFSQHSVNYHRVMLHDLLWAIRLGQVNNQPLPKLVEEKALIAANWMHKMIIGNKGQAPNYGSNDGALLFPLSNSLYTDYRPVVQSISKCVGRKIGPYEPGPWDEESIWFGGKNVVGVEEDIFLEKNLDLCARQGGYFTLRSVKSAGFIRCPEKFRHRPSHADMLHFDLWWQGENVAIDPGTFSYNSPTPWNNGLFATEVHNTVKISEKNQAEAFGRFLLLPWPKGRVCRQASSKLGHIAYFEGQHMAYKRLKPSVIHKRGIARVGDECWIITDSVFPKGCHDWEVNWLFPDVVGSFVGSDSQSVSGQLDLSFGKYNVSVHSLEGIDGFNVYRADKNSVRGWHSRYYQHKEPSVSLQVKLDRSIGVAYTIFAPDRMLVKVNNQQISLNGGDWHAILKPKLDVNPKDPLIDSIAISVHGQNSETLVLSK